MTYRYDAKRECLFNCHPSALCQALVNARMRHKPYHVEFCYDLAMRCKHDSSCGQSDYPQAMRVSSVGTDKMQCITISGVTVARTTRLPDLRTFTLGLEPGQSLQVSEKERQVELGALFKDVATVIVEKCINPETQRPYTVGLIERGLKDIHFAVDPKRSAKQQVSLNLHPRAQHGNAPDTSTLHPRQPSLAWLGSSQQAVWQSCPLMRPVSDETVQFVQQWVDDRGCRGFCCRCHSCAGSSLPP